MVIKCLWTRMHRKGTGTAHRGPQRKEPFGGEYETPLDVPVRHGGGGARLQGLGTGVGTCGLQTTCEEGLAFRGSWREGSRLGTCTAIHIYQVGRLDDLQPNVVCK